MVFRAVERQVVSRRRWAFRKYARREGDRAAKMRRTAGMDELPPVRNTLSTSRAFDALADEKVVDGLLLVLIMHRLHEDYLAGHVLAVSSPS
jgi:hypothetical protein